MRRRLSRLNKKDWDMSADKTPFQTTARRLLHAVKIFAASNFGWKAKWMFAALVGLLCGANALNVVNSFVGRNFMTAIADRDRTQFAEQAVFYIGVFAASSVVAALARFFEERLGLLWRDFLTRRAVSLYLSDDAYYQLETTGKLAHPDQRIAEDMRAFTGTTLSFVLMALNSSLTILAFSGVLWSISPILFIIAVLYAACGSYFIIRLGRPLIALNSDQLDKEASFRGGLIHLRENAEPIMMGGHEKFQEGRLSDQLDALIANSLQINRINLKVNLVTNGYNWLIQIIPALIIAPAFMRGAVEFGVVTQSAMAFSTLVAAFSLIITQFQSLSNFAAVVGRLTALMETMENLQSTKGTSLEIIEVDNRLAYEKLNLLTPDGKHTLLKNLTLSIASGARVLIRGTNQNAVVALFKATAGCAIPGNGVIYRPAPTAIFFLSERPYLPRGTLRQILGAGAQLGAPDQDILLPLHELNLDHILNQVGGLDVERDWQALLSLGEQHLLTLARALVAAPQFVFLDRIEAALGAEQFNGILHLLSKRSIGCIHIGDAHVSADLYDAVLECMDDGSWTWLTHRTGAVGSIEAPVAPKDA